MNALVGLTDAEAQKLLIHHGPNEINTKSKTTALSILLGQFKSPLVGILLVATAASLFLGDTLEGVLILLIVFLNAVLGFVQEYRAEKALEALQKITLATTRVLRGGVQQEVDSRYLVPGDIILLEEGNKVPADALLLESLHLEINESALTGESLPVEKSAHEKDEEKHHLYLGTIVAKGRATAKVITTGMNTRFGAIAKSLSTIEKEETPLEKKLKSVAKQLGVLAAGAAIAIFTIGYLQKNPMIEMILTAISLAVAAVPEGLPAVITITLAIGTQRMARKKAILRKLAAIEALGSVTVIATDKTGTLTKNEMRVTRVWMADSAFGHADKKLKGQKLFNKLLEVCILNNNASLAPVQDHGALDVVGDKTEGALLLLAADHGVDIEAIKEDGKLLEEFAFDTTTKTMTVVWRGKGGIHVHTKGAPESVLERSTRVYTKAGDIALTHKEKQKIIAAFESFAKEGLRLIALATKKMDWKHQSREHTESNLTFIGFVGIADPARAEVPQAIALANRAGIKTIMITGDNELTAMAIGKHIGLIAHGDEVLTGKQLASLSSSELSNKLGHVRVFARTTPEQKLTIVRALQRLGHVVGVTGDGVNDALALKQADVGVAMGRTGTDVAKEAADMIITDDNYASLVTAVEEGRAIFDNMKASIKYLIGCNIGEVIALLGGAILGLPFILTPIHILYVNLVTDGLPAIALALNPKHHDIMTRHPRTETALFNQFDLRWFFEVSTLTAVSTLVAFWIGYQTGNLTVARSLAFFVVVLAQQFIYLDIASGAHSVFSVRTLKNKWYLLPIATMAIQLVITNLPFTQNIFKITSPTQTALATGALVCFGMVVAAEVRKRFAHRFFYPH